MNAAPADPSVLAWTLWLRLLHWRLALTATASRLSRLVLTAIASRLSREGSGVWHQRSCSNSRCLRHPRRWPAG